MRGPKFSIVSSIIYNSTERVHTKNPCCSLSLGFDDSIGAAIVECVNRHGQLFACFGGANAGRSLLRLHELATTMLGNHHILEGRMMGYISEEVGY